MAVVLAAAAEAEELRREPLCCCRAADAPTVARPAFNDGDDAAGDELDDALLGLKVGDGAGAPPPPPLLPSVEGVLPRLAAAASDESGPWGEYTMYVSDCGCFKLFREHVGCCEGQPAGMEDSARGTSI